MAERDNSGKVHSDNPQGDQELLGNLTSSRGDLNVFGEAGRKYTPEEKEIALEEAARTLQYNWAVPSYPAPVIPLRLNRSN